MAYDDKTGLVDKYYGVIKDFEEKWTKDKSYRYGEVGVQTYHGTIDGEYWCGRFNEFDVNDGQGQEHGNNLYEKFMKYLIGFDADSLDPQEHTKHEKEYIHDLESYEVLETAPESIVVRLVYDIGPLFSKREFVEKVHIRPKYLDDPEIQVSLIVSSPVEEHEHHPGHVRAQYTACEWVSWDKSKGKIQWKMITKSDAKGHLPMWLQKLGINKSISKDVPSFINYVENK